MSAWSATTKAEAEMIAAGREWGATLESSDVVALVGQLGAGKTHFSKGIVAELGVDESVTSPTFGLVNEYLSGRIPVFHFDFYRMEEVDEVLRIGWEEYLDEEGVVIVEWADKFAELIPESAKWLNFSILENGEHQVSEK